MFFRTERKNEQLTAEQRAATTQRAPVREELYGMREKTPKAS